MVRGLPGINTRGFAVYLAMLESIREEVASGQCELIETVDDVFAEGMEGSGAPR